MTETQSDYVTEAMELLQGVTLEISEPQKVVERRGGKLVESDRPAFVKIYTDFKDELKSIDGDALKVWLFLALSINRYTKDARPGLRKIAEKTGLAVNTVRGAIERLETKYNLLDVEKEDGKGNQYHPSDYVSVSKDTVSNRDTVTQTVSKSSGTVSKTAGTVSGARKDSAQLEELESTIKKPDVLDGMIAYSQPREELDSLHDFERAFGFGALPWYSTSAWEKFAKWIIKTGGGWFADYVQWRNGDGKYKAFSNKKIRENPAAFMDTGYPEYEASKMYRKTDETRPEYQAFPFAGDK